MSGIKQFKMRRRILAGVVAAAFLSPVTGGAAFGKSPGSSTIEEVVVVAQRRDQSLQSVPISVTAMTSETLQQYGVDHSVLDLEFAIPGLQTTQVVAGFAPRIRGVGSTDSTPGNENSVSVYLDGVYLPGSANGLLSLSNIERIEVLKGPQGTLFGRNATGGLIHVITRDPARETGGNLSVSYDNFDTTIASGYATTGLGENVAVDIAGRWEDQGDGWGTNVFNGEDSYTTENQSARSRMLVTPGPATEVMLAADYYDYDSDIAPFRLESPSGFYDYNQNLNSGMDGDVWGVSANIEHEFEFATLVSISAYRDLNQGVTMDIDLGPTSFQHAFFEGYADSFSQELQLLSPDSSEFDWIVGLYYFDREAAFDPGAQRGSLLSLAFSPPLELFEVYNKQETSSYAAFAQATYPVFVDTNLTLGIRFTDDKQDYDGYTIAYPASGVPAENVSPTMTSELKSDKATYRVSVDHYFTPDIMAYVSWNTGFKSGFFNISGFPADSAGPETLTAYEVGLKSEFLDHRLRVNAAAYYYDFEDVQTQYILQGQAVAVNAGSASISGLELEVTTVPVDYWNIRLGFNWMPEAEYDEFAPCPGPQNPPWAFPPGSATYDCGGSDMINAPEWDVSLGTDYTIPTSAGEFNLSVAYQYMSDFPWDADFGIVTSAFGNGQIYNPDGVFIEPSRHVVNARATWTSPGDRVNVAIWGQNLTDEEYLVNANQSSGSGQAAMPGRPLTWGLTLGYKF